MGCGKSSVGRRLSELLCCPFMDLDEEIEARAGRSIPEIFAEDGEEAFREMELETLKGILYADSERLCTPWAPSHSGAAGPSPYPGVGKCLLHPTGIRHYHLKIHMTRIHRTSFWHWAEEQ